MQIIMTYVVDGKTLTLRFAERDLKLAARAFVAAERLYGRASVSLDVQSV